MDQLRGAQLGSWDLHAAARALQHGLRADRDDQGPGLQPVGRPLPPHPRSAHAPILAVPLGPNPDDRPERAVRDLDRSDHVARPLAHGPNRIADRPVLRPELGAGQRRGGAVPRDRLRRAATGLRARVLHVRAHVARHGVRGRDRVRQGRPWPDGRRVRRRRRGNRVAPARVARALARSQRVGHHVVHPGRLRHRAGL